MLSSVFQNLVGRESLIAAEDTWALLAIMCLGVAFSIYLEQKYNWASKVSVRDPGTDHCNGTCKLKYHSYSQCTV